MIQPHGGNIYAASREYKIPAEKITDFSANINPLGLYLSYPDPDCAGVKETLSKYLGIPKSNILIGNGSIEIIYLIPRLIIKPRVLIIGPTFSEYEKAVKISGGTVKYILTKEKSAFKLDLDSILPRLKGVDIVFICNPNNPTGVLFYKNEIKKIIRKASKKTLIVIDEAFMDFVDMRDKFSFIKDVSRIKNMLVIRSFTKFFGMAGLRVGLAAGNKDLITRLGTFQYPWSVNTIAQITAPIFIKDKSFIKRSTALNERERGYLYRGLKKIRGLKVFESASNFILCKIENNKLNSAKLAGILGRRGILIRDCSNFHGLSDKFIRVAVKKRTDNIKLLKALK